MGQDTTVASLRIPTPRPERALTSAQKHALLAMRPDAETTAAEIAEATGMRPNGTALALTGRERRGLAARHDDGEPATWTPTFAGRALSERLA